MLFEICYSIYQVFRFNINNFHSVVWFTQEDSECRLRGDRDKTIDHMISKCSALAKKEYKTRHDWLGKMIHWKLSKKFKFDHMNKWYMSNPASIPENETYKLQWDFVMQTDHLISARRLDLIIINKNNRTCKTEDFAVQADHWVKF